MKDKERTKNKFLKKIKTDYIFRTFIISALSFLVTVVFTGYNAFLAVIYESAWNISISVYYALLLCIRAYVICSELKFYKTRQSEAQKYNGRKKLYFLQSIFLFIIDVALIAPITMMVLGQRTVDYSKIPAISIAAYTTYKMILSAKNFIRTRKQNHLSLKILRNVNFIDALVSVLSLQYTLIMTFGGGIMGDMLTLCAVSSFAIWAFIIVISVLTLIDAVQIHSDVLVPRCMVFRDKR